MKRLLGMVGSSVKGMANLEFWKGLLKDQLKGALKSIAASAMQFVAIKLIKEYLMKRPIKAIRELCKKNNVPMPDFDFNKKFDIFELAQ